MNKIEVFSSRNVICTIHWSYCVMQKETLMATQIPPPFHVPDEGDVPHDRDPDAPPQPEDPREDDESYKLPPGEPPAEIKEPRITGV